MERARATWTDERLDDLSRRMDAGFDRVDEGLRALSARVDVQGAELSGRFGALEARIDSLQRTMIQVGGGMGVAILATLLSVILTRA